MDKEFKVFRTAAFGGFNRKDVISYIEKMRNESYEYKIQVEQMIKSLNEKICELENAARLMDNSDSVQKIISEEIPEENLADIGQATKHLKTVADELCRSLGDFMDKLDKKGLFENEESDFTVEEAADETDEAERVSLVDGILSSIGYLAPEKEVVSDEVKKEREVKSVKDMFENFGFMN